MIKNAKPHRVEVIESSVAFRDRAPARAAVALGNFDGVHIGHQAIIRAAGNDAKARAVPSVVFTFEPHPGAVVGRGEPPRLSTPEEKQRYVEALGVDYFLVEPFTKEYAAQTPREFVERVLVKRLNVGTVFVGGDFGFGKGRSGSVEVLADLGKELGFTITAADAVLVDGVRVSSSQIREQITSGDVAAAAVRLSRPYELGGLVVSGHQRGKDMGLATANVKPEKLLLPARGVYATRVALPKEDGEVMLDAVTNVGVQPTFGGNELTVEAHILDFDEDLYGKRIALHFIDRLREERRFDKPSDLVEQIRRDIETARKILEALPRPR